MPTEQEVPAAKSVPKNGNPSEGCAPLKQEHLLLQSARRQFAKSANYDTALEVQIAMADMNRAALANRTFINICP